MVEMKIVKVIGSQNQPLQQKPVTFELLTFDPALTPASGTTTALGLPGGSTLVDNTRTEATSHWDGQLIEITSGIDKGQVREIVTWNLVTFTFTVSPVFEAQVIAGITYNILANLAADIETAAIQANLGTIADVEAEAGTALARLLFIKNGIRKGAGTVLPANKSLYDFLLAIPSQAFPFTNPAGAVDLHFLEVDGIKLATNPALRQAFTNVAVDLVTAAESVGGFRSIYTDTRAGYLDKVKQLTRPQKGTQATTNALVVVGAAIEDAAVPFIVEGYINLALMQVGDTFLIVEEVRDQDDLTYVEFARQSYSDVQISPMAHFLPKRAQGWRVRIQMTAGANRNVTYQFFTDKGVI